MKKLYLILTVFLISSQSGLAQTTFFAGANFAESTNIGHFGINPNLEMKHPLSNAWSVNTTLEGFLGLRPIESNRELRSEYHHRSLFANIGINYKLINKNIGWTIGAGPSFVVGSEQYVASAGFGDDQILDFKTEKENFAQLGLYFKNSISFSPKFNLNITIHRFDYTGQYVSIGPSFRIK